MEIKMLGMYNFKKIFFIFFLAVCTVMVAQAQKIFVFASAGGYGEDANVSLSWTIGEVFVETYEGASNVITQGFHQSKLITTDMEQADDLSFKILAYPNPTMDEVFLKTEENISNLSYILYNLKGEILEQKRLESNHVSIAMGSYISSMYLLRVMENEKALKVFKIIKK